MDKLLAYQQLNQYNYTHSNMRRRSIIEIDKSLRKNSGSNKSNKSNDKDDHYQYESYDSLLNKMKEVDKHL